MQIQSGWKFLIASVAFGACLFASGEAHAKEEGSEKNGIKIVVTHCHSDG